VCKKGIYDTDEVKYYPACPWEYHADHSDEVVINHRLDDLLKCREIIDREIGLLKKGIKYWDVAVNKRDVSKVESGLE